MISINKMMKSKIVKTLSVLSLGVSLFSCEVGLGESVDINAPVVKVISPERTGYILQDFSVTGTAEDDFGISSMTLQIEPLDNATEDNTYKFRVQNNTWEKYDNSSQNWVPYNYASSSISGNKKKFNWNLDFSLDNSVQSGTDFLITTQIYDFYSNESKDSRDERSVTVDMVPPVVSLIAPVVKSSYSAENSKSYALKDNSVLSNLLNGKVEINGFQKEDSRLDYLMVYIDEESSNTINSSNSPLEVYDEANSLVWKDRVEGENLRNWSTSADLSKISGFEHDRKTLRLITESHDQAGNIQTKVQGWFTYYNDADIPWIVANFGGDDSEHKVSVYPNCALQGQAYDDDGLSELKIAVYKDDGSGEVYVRTDTFDLSKENYPVYKAWSVNALAESCDFRLVITAKDKYGTPAETVTRYMKVTDTNPPSIVINTDTTVTMFGDASGKVNLSGYVTDDGGINKLKLVRVKTGADATDLIKYYNSLYSEWEKATTSGYVDENGNKIWDIPLTTPVRVNSGEDAGKLKSTFNKDFNIFTDFGINGSQEKLTTQNFIIMATDNSNCANIDSFTWAGDKEAPKLKISKLEVKAGSTTKETIDFDYYKQNQLSKKLATFNKSNGSITDKIVLSGTWSDDSTDVWTDKAKKSPIVVTWEGVSNIVVHPETNGNWYTDPITPPDVTTAIIDMSFTDYAGNIAKASENFFVSSNNPELLRISSEQNDGSFNNEKKITITLEFNKAVTFEGNGTNPTLTLNTCKVANYIDGNGTTTHKFEYLIEAKDETKGTYSSDKVLDVTAINTNNNIWKDGDGIAVPNLGINAVSDSNRLKKTRSLVIDTDAPYLTELTAISPSGSYNKDKEIFIQATFSEDVKIETVNNFKLELNVTDSKLYTSSAVKTGPNTVLFTYPVKDGHSTPALDINSVVIAGAGIVDTAGNPLVNPTTSGDKAYIKSKFTGIIIDTDVPLKPGISGVKDGAYIYATTGAKFTLTNIAKDAVIVKYSVDGGSVWSDYPGDEEGVKLQNNGEYTIIAYQQDAAGNKSEESDQIKINIDAGNILTSVTSGDPTGTYTTGHTIPIYLNFRKKITVDTEASLALNLSNGQTATFVESDKTGTKALFNYTIQEGDSSEGLNVERISGTFKDEKGNNVNEYITTIPEGKNLLDTRTIKIVTGRPVIQSVALTNDGTLLDIVFSKPVVKGNGKNITFTHQTGYKAPAVLSVAEYNSLPQTLELTDPKQTVNLSDYYELGTNGSSSTCVSDLDEKYVLKYGIDTKDSTLTKYLKQADADKVIVSVNSTYVTIINQNTVRVTLTGSKALPVKGAQYTVFVDEDFVKDAQNHGNAAISANQYKVDLGGVEKPVIRIKKIDEVIKKSNNYTVTQPKQATVKIDCQTPGVEIKYSVSNTANDPANVSSDGNEVTETKYQTRASRNIVAPVAKPTAASENNIKSGSTYSEAFAIGNNSDTAADLFKGYIYLICAKASKGSGSSAVWSDTSYETAYRTAVQILDHDNGSRFKSQFWIRGGDSTYGNVSAKNFPISWNNEELDKIRCMSRTTGTNNLPKFYWITWKINTTAYVGFLNADIVADSVTDNDGAGGKGPSNWCWCDCGIVPYKDRYPLPPGGALCFYTGENWGTWVMLNQQKKHEYRDSNDVVHKGDPS